MRICVVSDQAFPAWGGEGIVTQNLCRKLSEGGHQVLFLTTKVSHPSPVKNIEVIRFPSIFIPQKGHFGVVLFSRIVPILKERKIQIIQVNLPTFLGWQSFIAARKLNIPLVAGFHVQIGNLLPCNLSFCFFLEKLITLWFSHFYKKADLLISPSNLGGKIVSHYSSSRVEVISNGIDFSIFSPSDIFLREREEFRKRFGLKDSPFLLYVGRLSREKNICYLFQIMQVLREKNNTLMLLVAGKGKLQVALQKKAYSMGLSKKVIFAGFLTKSDLFCAYKEADIFILPSLFELQGMAVLEAMAMGKAVLVGRSSQSAACELVQEGINGYTFDLRDPCDAAEKIHLILSQSNLKESMQKASLGIAQAHNIKISISKVEQLYHQLLLNC